MHTPEHMMDGMKLSHLRKELKSIRKEYYKPLSKMSRTELIEEHTRHSGLMVGKKSMPEPMPSASLEKRIENAHVNIKKQKVIPGLPQAMGTTVGAETREGGKAMGGSPKTKKVKRVESEGSGMVGVPNVQDMPKSGKASKKSAVESSVETNSSKESNPPAGKKVSAYNTFFGKHRREGKSIAEIAEMWRNTKK